MKRIASYTHELDKTELKRLKLLDSIQDANENVIRRAIVKSKKDSAVYIRNVTDVVRSQPIEEDMGRNPMIEECLKNPDFAMLIISHLGPHELYIMTRVSWQFKIVTSNAFLDLAPLFLDIYAGELTDYQTIGQFKFEKESLCDLILAYKKKLLSMHYPPPIEDLFALWFRVQRKYRLYGKDKGGGYITRKKGNTVIIEKKMHAHIDYAFVYDIAQKRLIRLKDLNVYQSSKFAEIGKRFKKAWLAEKKDVPFPENEHPLSLFRTKDIQDMAFLRVTGDFRKDHAFIFEGGHITELLDGDRYKIYYCASLSMVPQGRYNKNCPPFFDYYEQRLAYERKASDTRAYSFMEPLALHRLRLMSFCNLC